MQIERPRVKSYQHHDFPTAPTAAKTQLPHPHGVLSTPQKGRPIVSHVLNLYTICRSPALLLIALVKHGEIFAVNEQTAAGFACGLAGDAVFDE